MSQLYNRAINAREHRRDFLSNLRNSSEIVLNTKLFIRKFNCALLKLSALHKVCPSPAINNPSGVISTSLIVNRITCKWQVDYSKQSISPLAILLDRQYAGHYRYILPDLEDVMGLPGLINPPFMQGFVNAPSYIDTWAQTLNNTSILGKKAII